MPSSHEQESDDQKLEELNSRLEQARDLLTSWVGSEDSDSVARRNLRIREYADACSMLQQIWRDTYGTDISLGLTMPAEGEPFRGHYFSKNAYDFIEKHVGRELEPAETVILKSHEEHTNMLQRATNVYFGDYKRYFEVADIGRILSAGGTLDLIDNPRPE